MKPLVSPIVMNPGGVALTVKLREDEAFFVLNGPHHSLFHGFHAFQA